ncbi:hypothetical protein HWV62_29258 [Athelia sp. TMB]|nr:hypothetical protein HWV62_29258 [Athelia sp. TMB]
MLLDLQPEEPRPKKRLSMVQAYSKKYYQTVLKPIADSRYEEHLRDAQAHNYTPMKQLDHSNKVVAEHWAQEPQTIIDEIARYREYLYLHPEGSDEESDDSFEDDGSDDEELDCQAATGRTLTPLLQELQRRTGYVGALILAAPDPARGGELSTISLFIGKTPHGMDWGQHYTRDLWRQHIEDPLVAFAGLVYPPEKREEFRLAGVSVHISATEAAYVNSQAPTPSAQTSRSISRTPAGPSTRSTFRQTSIPNNNTLVEQAMALDSREERQRVESDTDVANQLGNESDGGTPWEMDKLLTRTQMSQILAEKSYYGRNKAYNIIRNKRELDALGLQKCAKEVVDWQPKKKTAQPNTTSSPSRSPSPTAMFPSAAFLPHTQDDDFEGNLGANSQREDSPERQSCSRSPSPNAHNQSPHASPTVLPVDNNTRPSPRPPSSHDGSTSPQRPDSPTVPMAPQRPDSPMVPSSPQQPASPIVADISPVDEGSKSRPPAHASLATLRPSLADTHETRSRWPAWMSEIVPAMEEVAPASEELSAAMKAWVEFEDLMGYPDSLAKKNVLSSEHRPHDVHAWVKAHRKPRAMPDVTDRVDEFAKEWREWWDGLQPKTDQPASFDARNITDYSELQKASRNGIFLLLASLVWWGGGVLDQGEEKMRVWRAAVQEFASVVQFFNNHLKNASGRKRARKGSEISTHTTKRTRKG